MMDTMIHTHNGTMIHTQNKDRKTDIEADPGSFHPPPDRHNKRLTHTFIKTRNNTN